MREKGCARRESATRKARVVAGSGEVMEVATASGAAGRTVAGAAAGTVVGRTVAGMVVAPRSGIGEEGGGGGGTWIWMGEEG